MSYRRQKTVLAIIATDNTVARAGDHWRGKCIHCRRWLAIGVDGTPISRATIEHIVPRNHGGGDTLENLALACARCNHEKGKRHDHRARGTPRLEHVIGQLQRERQERFRPPAIDLSQPAARRP